MNDAIDGMSGCADSSASTSPGKQMHVLVSKETCSVLMAVMAVSR
jgi:hypothetical protein